MDPSVRGFTMRLRPGCADEYKRRHDEIWPELATLLREVGISRYSIFLDAHSDLLFACFTLDHSNRLAELPEHPTMQKWWQYMAPLMETEASHRPIQHDLTLMFHMP